MILTPEQIESFWNTRWCHGSIEQAMADTILAYAEIVQRVAEWDWHYGQGLPKDGAPEIAEVMEAYLAARKLRGLDGT